MIYDIRKVKEKGQIYYCYDFKDGSTVFNWNEKRLKRGLAIIEKFKIQNAKEMEKLTETGLKGVGLLNTDNIQLNII